VAAGVGLVILIAVAATSEIAGTWFAQHASPAQSAAASRPSAPPLRPSSPKPSASRSGHPGAFTVGTCVTEPTRDTGVQSVPVPCSGEQAVLEINQVVEQASDCSAGADYAEHGFELVDSDAHVSYCLSLVVPAGQCFVFSNDNSTPFQRANCGSAPNAVRVLSVESSPNVETACVDQTSPDIWFYSSPSSGQYACVSRPTS
jgi:hypothetical protein